MKGIYIVRVEWKCDELECEKKLKHWYEYYVCVGIEGRPIKNLPQKKNTSKLTNSKHQTAGQLAPNT